MHRSPSLVCASSFSVRILAAASLLALGILGACGGKQLGGGPADSGSGADGGVFTESDGATCVDIDLATYDKSCHQASDCITVASGPICDGYCNCGGGDASVNRSEEGRYQSALALVTPSNGICGCITGGVPDCVHGTCMLCGAQGCAVEFDGGVGASDGGVGFDDGSTGTGGDDGGSSCVDINLATYNQSCKRSSDCISITSGKICSGSCACGGATVNKSDEGKYEAAISGLTLEDCPCVEEGSPTCVLGMCKLCGGPDSPPGCPDGG